MALYVISCQRSLAAAHSSFSRPFPLGLNVCLIYNYVGLSIFHSLEDPFFFILLTGKKLILQLGLWANLCIETCITF